MKLQAPGETVKKAPLWKPRYSLAKKFQQRALVHKKTYPEIPPKVEYRLTKLGLKTLPIVDKLAEFGLENLV